MFRRENPRRIKMFRRIDNHKRTAAVTGNTVTIMFDDGWETLLDCRQTFASQAEAKAWLADGWEEFDPNAELKAKGFVWNGHCYAKP